MRLDETNRRTLPIASDTGATTSSEEPARSGGEAGREGGAAVTRPAPFGGTDLLLVAVLLLFSAVCVLPALRHGGAAPTEDAAMLLRYSQHLAQHQGITWNVGEHPVEGATDFLYMAAIAGVARVLHRDALTASRMLLFVCWIALPPVVFACCRFTLRGSRWLAFALALYAVSSPGGAYLESTFGVPFMLLTVALAWWVGVALIAGRGRVAWGMSLLFSLLALLIGLTRPEGNILAVLLLASIVFLRGLRETRRLVLTFGAVFLVLGGSYFAWRMHYFGYALPNPFYVKGGGHLHPQGLFNGAENVVKILWPALPLALLALRNRYRTRLLLGLLIPVTGYTLIWVLLSNENNHLFRFQMPLLPVALMFLPLLVEKLFEELPVSVAQISRRARLGLASAAAVYTVAVCYCLYRTIFSIGPSNSGEEFAGHLSRYADRGYTMAVTEAGTFPYFSQWKAIDVLGLNDATIAHHGLDEAYLDRYQPELILYHLYRLPSGGGRMHQDSVEITQRDVHAMEVLHAYAVHHRYILAAAYGGEPCSLHFFYVRPDTPDTDAIVSYLRTTPYYFLDNGILSADYRGGVRPECGLPELGD